MNKCRTHSIICLIISLSLLMIIFCVGCSDSTQDILNDANAKVNVTKEHIEETTTTPTPTDIPTPSPTEAPTPTPEETTTDTSITETEETKSSDDETVMVWIPKSGHKYHNKSSCSRMKNPKEIPLDDAVKKGYEPCKKCYG